MATNWACRMGSEDCLEATNTELHQNLENINSNMRPTIYCNGLRSNDSNFVLLKDTLNTTFDSNERIILLTALGCSQNKSLLDEYIQSSKDNIYMSQAENYRVFTSVLDNGQLGLSVAVEFLDKYFLEAAAAYGSTNINNAIIATATNIVSTEIGDKVNDEPPSFSIYKVKIIFLLKFSAIVQTANNLNMISEETYNRTQKILQDNKEWSKNRQESIDNWLEELYKSSGNKGATFSFSAIVVLACFRILMHF